jgi:hypothetical protein
MFVIAAVIYALLFNSVLGAFVAFGVYYIALSMITFSHILAFSPPKRQESESVPPSHSTPTFQTPSAPSKHDLEYGTPLSSPSAEKSIEQNKKLGEDEEYKTPKNDKQQFQKLEEVSSTSNED